MDINDLWSQFMEGDDEMMMDYMNTFQEEPETTNTVKQKIFTQQDLSIATKTMIAYLNQPVDIRNIYWNIPLIQYHEPRVGIIKKQIKWTCETDEEVEQLEQYLSRHNQEDIPMTVDILKQMNKGRFKDIRKISIGLCKKSLISYRSKKKSAFYNCIVTIMRVRDLDDTFKEIHVKLFNTGKMEIPGIQDDRILFRALDTLVYLLNHSCMSNVSYSKEEKDIQTVLINSNFHCGYTVNRQALYERLKYEYGFNALYDPCKYPGVQCKFYFKKDTDEQNGICECDTPCSKKGRPRNAPTGPCLELTFMVFRTGSILIVGHCREKVLRRAYETITQIMTSEKQHCMLEEVEETEQQKPNSKKRQRKIRLKVSPSIYKTYEENHTSGLLYLSDCIKVEDVKEVKTTNKPQCADTSQLHLSTSL